MTTARHGGIVCADCGHQSVAVPVLPPPARHCETIPPPARQTSHWAENVIICANCPGHRATNGHHYRYYMSAEAKLKFQCRNTLYLYCILPLLTNTKERAHLLFLEDINDKRLSCWNQNVFFCVYGRHYDPLYSKLTIYFPKSGAHITFQPL